MNWALFSAVFFGCVAAAVALLVVLAIVLGVAQVIEDRDYATYLRNKRDSERV